MAGKTVGHFRRLMSRWGYTVDGEIIVEPPPVIVDPLDAPPDPGVGTDPYIPDPPTTPFQVTVHGLRYVWDDVFGFWKDKWHQLTSWFTGGVSITTDAIESAITNAINVDMTAWSTFVNILDGYIGAVSSAVFHDLENLTQFAGDGLTYAIHLTYTVGDYIGAVLNADVEMLLNTITGLETFLSQAEQAQTQAIQQWTYDNIFRPLYENIGQAEAQATLQFQGALQAVDQLGSTIEPTAQRVASATVAPALAAIAVLAPAVSALKTITDECTVPMCETMGPNTNLGKMLKNLEKLLALFAGYTLAGLTEHDLEVIAGRFGSIAEGSVERFMSSFVDGGGTLGGAGAEVLGEATGVVTAVLGDLGIPGF